MRKKIYWGINNNKKDIAESIEEIISEKSQQQGNEHSNDESHFLEVVDNSIYFYSDICPEKILKLRKEIELLAINLETQANTQKRAPANIFLHLSSFGGSLLDGFSGMDAILNSTIPVITIIDGYCASAATLLSIAGSKRYMNKHSYILIHQLSSCFWGKYEEWNDEKENLDKMMGMLLDVYNEYTKIPEKKLLEILKHDLWFQPSEALRYGLADTII